MPWNGLKILPYFYNKFALEKLDSAGTVILNYYTKVRVSLNTFICPNEFLLYAFKTKKYYVNLSSSCN